MRLELAPPRLIPAPPDRAPAGFVAWIEAALLVRIVVAAWQHEAVAWQHWVARLREDGVPDGPPRRFDPGRHAARPEQPESAARGNIADVGEPEAMEFVAAIVAAWKPELHRHEALGLVAVLDERRDEFRRRCLSLVRPLVQRSGASAGELAALAAGIESVSLGPHEIEVRHARVGVVWYPEGLEPLPPPGELMVRGEARGAR